MPTNTKPIPRVNALVILALGIVFICGYGIFLRATGWRADFAESNFQANIARIQGYLYGSQPDAVLAGSSVSGRLLSRYFAGKDLQVSNLGLDGSGVGFALEVIARRQDSPPILLLETYSVFQKAGTNDQTLRESIETPSFFLARYLSVMRAESRPSAFLYSMMKQKGDRPAARVPAATRSVPMPAIVPSSTTSLPEGFLGLRDRLISLSSANRKIYLVRIPTGNPDFPRPSDAADRLSEETGIAQIDITAMNLHPTYTDGLHLSSESAETVCRIISARVRGESSP